MKRAIWVTAAIAAGTVTANAQNVVSPAPVPSVRQNVVAGAVEAKITPGRPYAGEAVTEMVQVLADGNRISRTSTSKVYRDGEGRTRRENYSSEGKLLSISISDPVGHVSYTLNPETKVAYRTGGTVAVPPTLISPGGGGARTEAVASGGGGGGRGGGSATVLPRTAPPTAMAETVAPAGGGGGRGGGMMMRTAGPDDPNVKREDLPAQMIEGVMATGFRQTTTIPVGQIGNAQEIRIVSERWMSEDLGVLLLTRHSDPRSGETTYRLRNIVRAEPDPSLFTVPSDYTVQSRGVRRPQ